MSKKATIQANFGASAELYGKSAIHAKGESLARLVTLADPQPHWRVLDIGTGGGHTAMAFAPLVAEVIATDITQPMLDVTAKLAAERGLTNIRTEIAHAEKFPYPDASFDLVVCRLAAHHFDDIFAFLQESARVLKSGATLGIVDNTVPEDEAGAEYINAYETLRDPGHQKCLSAEMWEQELFAAGLTQTASESSLMPIQFQPWAQRMRVTPINQTRLKAMLKQAPDSAKAILSPIFDGGCVSFHLQKTVIIAKKV